MKTLLLFLALALTLQSCHDSKYLALGQDPNQVTNVKPYGWFDLDAKNDSVKYRVVVGNVVWSIILCETIVVPVVLTGCCLYEPVEVK